jgi:hypothetical protein
MEYIENIGFTPKILKSKSKVMKREEKQYKIFRLSSAVAAAAAAAVDRNLCHAYSYSRDHKI